MLQDADWFLLGVTLPDNWEETATYIPKDDPEALAQAFNEHMSHSAHTEGDTHEEHLNQHRNGHSHGHRYKYWIPFAYKRSYKYCQPLI